MMSNGAEFAAVKAVTAFMKPYAKEFRKLERTKRKASEWNDRATLRAQQMGGARKPTSNAKRALDASTAASGELDKASIAIMQEYHRQFEGWEFSSLRQMNAAISNGEWGSGKEIKGLGEELSKEKHKAARYAKLPIAIIGFAALFIGAITKHFATAGIIALAGAAFAMGIAEAVVNAVFSRRERALATWENAAARVKGLAEDGNGDAAMDALIQENALVDGVSMN
ncbi:MAG: hypothetical protein NTX79_03650 [Candidatus Micrarchaeota archaeon]|nr:hypothetical protein [Candidatus Micrarchaeota archaeon]